MYKSASRGRQRALSAPAFKYSAPAKAEKLSAQGAKKVKKPRRYKTPVVTKAARGRDNSPEARMRGVVVQKIVELPNGKTVRVTRKMP
jgi:hypothetical protein